MKAHLLITLALTIASANAAPITLDLTSGGTGSGSGFGNSRMWTVGGITVTATAWSTTGSSSSLQTGQLGQYSLGLGVCNQGEGTGCGSPGHQVDNSGYLDFVLFTFSAPVSSVSFLVTPAGNYDTDVTYFTRNSGTAFDLTNSTLAQIVSNLGFNSGLNDDRSGTGNTNDVPVTGSGIRSILLGSRVNNADQNYDYFKITSLAANTDPREVVTPEPATFGLLGAALLGIGLVRRKKANR